MTEKKKMGAGLVLSVITVLVTVAGLVLYMMNCKTNYFVKTTGTDNTIVACLAVAAILEIVMIIVSVKMGAKPVLDIIPVACDRMCGRSDLHDYFLLLQSSKGLIL